MSAEAVLQGVIASPLSLSLSLSRSLALFLSVCVMPWARSRQHLVVKKCVVLGEDVDGSVLARKHGTTVSHVRYHQLLCTCAHAPMRARTRIHTLFGSNVSVPSCAPSAASKPTDQSGNNAQSGTSSPLAVAKKRSGQHPIAHQCHAHTPRPHRLPPSQPPLHHTLYLPIDDAGNSRSAT